jgi:hypothetical protein
LQNAIENLLLGLKELRNGPILKKEIIQESEQKIIN